MFKRTNQSSDSEPQVPSLPNIEKNLVLNERIDSNHLICSICMHIVWKAVVCGSSTGCHNIFCQQCIKTWLQTNHSCPTCKRHFVFSSPPPIIISLLDSLRLRCPNYKEGCQEQISYSQSDKHPKICQYILQKCKGCRKKIIKKFFKQHVDNCPKIMTQCPKCRSLMTRQVYKNHTNIDCLSTQIEQCGERVQNIDQGITEINASLKKLQDLTNCFFVGQPLQLNIQLYTTFNQHFVFPNPTLIKPSFNQQKQKFDFLHFYILNPIYTDSIASIKWGIKINKMLGNILVGFCSNMGIHSLDYIINKYGEIKRKNTDETKYKLVRKAQKGFSFHCGDSLRFRYYSLSKCIKIENVTKRTVLTLQESEIAHLGQRIYPFYSMDTLNDSISFI